MTLLNLMTARALELEAAGSLLTFLTLDPTSSEDVEKSARTAFYQAAIRYVEAIQPGLRAVILARLVGPLPTEEQAATQALIGVLATVMQEKPELLADFTEKLREWIGQMYRPPKKVD